MKKWRKFCAAGLFLLGSVARAQPVPAAAQAAVHFENKLRAWDGFGVNYVEAPMTRDYKKSPQDYSGFSTLSEQKRQEIIELTFGPDGVKPGIIKMFLDPFHEGMTKPAGESDPKRVDMSRFDHATTTQWMRYFVREGLKRTRALGDDLQIITTLHGPPPWTTKQNFTDARDLDPAEKYEVANYMISWVKYLRDVERFPVKYISLHNEGEGWDRWLPDGSNTARGDHNMWWPATQVVDFLRFMRPMMDEQGLQEVGLTPGETSNWDAFGRWYAYFIYSDPEASKNLGLLTSHGFGLRMNGSLGVDTVRLVRPDLHAWTTSLSWGRMDVSTFVEVVRQNIYDAKLNAVIPWCYVQTDDWRLNDGNPGGDPNPGTAFWVDRKGGYNILPGYYLFKQLSRAGQPGMAVANVSTSDPDIQLIAFASNGSKNPDAFVVYNLAERFQRDVRIRVTGSDSKSFDAYISGFRERYNSLGTFEVRNGVLECTVPAQGVITFFAKRLGPSS
jgi:hypothetical protein